MNKRSAATRNAISKIAREYTSFPDELRSLGRKHKVKRLPMIPMKEMKSIAVPMILSKFSIEFDCNMLCGNSATNQVK